MQRFFFGGGGAVVAYSAGVSQPVRSESAPWNFSIDFTAHSSKLSEPLPFLSSLANALRRGASNSSLSILPFLFLSARLNRFSSRLFGLASGAWSGCPALKTDSLACRGGGAGGSGLVAARDCQKRNALVRSKNAAAAPARKRAKRYLHYIGDSAQLISIPERPLSTGQRRPVSRCRSSVQARPGVAWGSSRGPRLRSRAASAARAVSGLADRAIRRPPVSGVSTATSRNPRREMSATANRRPAAPIPRSSNPVLSRPAPSLKSVSPRC